MSSKFSLKINKMTRVMMFVFPIFILLCFIILFNLFFSNILYFIIASPFLIGSFWNFYKFLKRPVRIDIYDNHVTFRFLISKNISIRYSDFSSIECKDNVGLIIKTKNNKKINLSGFDKLDRLLTEIKNNHSINYQV